nr:PREDICTED: uncharacterized protein LOC105678237 [Linepithema humile]
MSWEERTKWQGWITAYFTKEKNFYARCRNRSCRKPCTYVSSLTKFKDHVNKTHSNIYNHEEANRNQFGWKYFILTEENATICILCNILITEFPQNEILIKHVNEHAKKGQYIDKRRDWFWKYLYQVGDFSAKCKLCPNKNEEFNFYLTTLSLKAHMKAHENEQTKLTEEWTYLIENNYFLNKCYVKSVNFRAECQFCKRNFVCVPAIVLKTHIQEHDNIYRIEENEKIGTKLGKIWSYFRFTKNEAIDEIECMICKDTLSNDQMENHAKTHNLQKLIPCNFDDWAFKYAREEEDFLKCTICDADEWKCLRYTYDMEISRSIECVICHQQDVMINHRCSQDLKPYSQHWVFKYARQDRSNAYCTICGQNINYDYDFDTLKNHMSLEHQEKWKTIEQEEQIKQQDLEQGTAHDEAGPSTSYAS